MFDQSRDPGLILGIDPGLSRCGYGAVRRDGHRMVPVAFGVLRTPPEAPLPERLAQLQADLDALFDDLMPSGVAVERILFQVNARTAITVGQASGLALAAAARRGIPVVHYSPNEVKLAVTGYGAADKQQVQAMVARLLQPRVTAEATRRRRRARARAVPLVGGAAARGRRRRRHGRGERVPASGRGRAREGGRSVIGSVRGSVLERLRERRGARRGRRRRLPRARPARRGARADARRAGVLVHAPPRARGRAGAVRLPDARRARHLRGAARRRRRRTRSSRSRSSRCTLRSRCGERCSRTISMRSRWSRAWASAPRPGSSSISRPGSTSRSSTSSMPRASTNNPRAEVREALTGLGYAPDEVRSVIGQLPDDGAVEDLLRDALKRLAAVR